MIGGIVGQESLPARPTLGPFGLACFDGVVGDCRGLDDVLGAFRAWLQAYVC
jgi:hypothetical protein